MKISDKTVLFIQVMKEKSKELCKRYTDRLEQVNNDRTDTKVLTLAANMEKDNEMTYSILEEISVSLNQLYDKTPTENQIASAKIESTDTNSSITLTSEQLRELEEREKRAKKIYG